MYRLSGRSHARIGRIAVAASILLVAFAVATAASAAPLGVRGALREGVSPARASASAGELERELLASLNRTRVAYGMRPLRRSRGLAAAADHHSRSMARRGFFSHSSADGSPFHWRIERFYRRPSDWDVYVVGENLFYGDADVGAPLVLRAWLGSPTHRRNVLGDWREVGFGALRVDAAPGFFGGATVSIVTADFGIRG